MRLCERDGCQRRHHALGLCQPCYGLERYGHGTRSGRHVDFGPLDDASASVLADRYRTSTRSIQRWRRDGIPLCSAERLAELMGLHPLELWPDLYSDAA